MKASRRSVVAAIVGVAGLLVLGHRIGLQDELPAVKSAAGVRADLLDIDAQMTMPRAHYNYSVIPGGVLNAQELRDAVNRDAVVAHHYRGINSSTMRPQILQADRLAYVSYRLGDRVYWTSHKVRIRSGETILTNGQTEIRSRCGNCIATEPQLPTSADEPSPMELDSLSVTPHPMQADALTGNGPVLVSWPLDTFGPRAVSQTGGAGTAAVTAPEFGGAMFPSVASAFRVRPIVEEASDADSGSSILRVLPDSGPGVEVTLNPPGVAADTTTPGAVTPPFVAGSSHLNVSADGPSASYGLDALLDAPVLPLAPATPPGEMAPVPEPGTLMLVGAGIAGLLARRWRVART